MQYPRSVTAIAVGLLVSGSLLHTPRLNAQTSVALDASPDQSTITTSTSGQHLTANEIAANGDTKMQQLLGNAAHLRQAMVQLQTELGAGDPMIVSLRSRIEAADRQIQEYIQQLNSTATVATTPYAAPTPLLRTQDVESGAVRLSDVDSVHLEYFLQDLNKRKDFDFSCHGGQAGPNADYLAMWVQRVTDELCNRGYYFDTAGNFRRPGAIVAVR